MENLFKILENPNDMLISVDMDGVLCEGEFWGEGEPKPNQKMIDLVWQWYKKGAHIIICTARQPRYFAVTMAWLIKYEVPFHGISMFCKNGCDVLIDDKVLNVLQVYENIS